MKYEELSYERKRLSEMKELPSWYSTAGYQLLLNKNYLLPGETPRGMYHRVAKRASDVTSSNVDVKDFGYNSWYEAFFDVMWKGWLSPSTPVLSNMGTNRGMSVSCSGSAIEDNIRGFYLTRMELAQLTQMGFGTSTCLDPIRHRGSPISRGGVADGIVPVAEGIVDDMDKISQGGTRKGSCGIYLNVLHPDFDELCDKLLAQPDGLNVGWAFDKGFDDLLERNPNEADRIWKKILRTKMITGKGYFFFKEKVNAQNPKMYKDRGLEVKHSNLCMEIFLFNDKDNTFTCTLSSLNVAKYDEWKDTKLPEIAMVFLDAINADLLDKASKIEGFERVVNFVKRTNAVGLGVLGLSTYYQQRGWAFGDMMSITFNQKFFKELNEKTLKASKYLAKKVGEPEWMKGYGERFSHRLALPPTMSTSAVLGGISQGIEPVFANVFTQKIAGGLVFRVNPVLLPLMKERGVYNRDTLYRISSDNGSVQAEEWLSDEEKKVFRTAFEISQDAILLMASHRQKEVDQGQSLNLYFNYNTPEEEISRLHFKAYKDPYIKGLYYVRSLNKAMKVQLPTSTCEACEG